MEKKDSNDEFSKFVDLVEEYKIILSKSQLPAIKTQKHEAIAEMIVKWATISGQTLTEQTLLKKLHNMKSRTNAAAEKKTLSDWQSKLRELISSDSTFNMAQLSSTTNDDEENTADKKRIFEKIIPSKRKAEEILNSWETDDTKEMTNEQLQRFLLLKKLKLMNLQIEKLEKPPVSIQLVELLSEEESKNIVDDLVDS